VLSAAEQDLGVHSFAVQVGPCRPEVGLPLRARKFAPRPRQSLAASLPRARAKLVLSEAEQDLGPAALGKVHR
jgi:hypothetical protein